jgi:hypothetical protein
MTPARAGVLCLATGVIGAVSAVVLLLWPPQVAETLVSYPFTTRGFLVAQAWFFLHHFGVVPALVVLAQSPAITGGRVARAGAWLSVFAMVGLSAAELLAMRYADFTDIVANGGLMGTAYGVTVTAVGVGMVLAGIGVARTHRWSGWHRWTPLATGLAVFAVVTPGMFGAFVVARLAIGFWFLLLAALGWSMYQHAGVPSRPGSHTNDARAARTAA